MALNPVLLKSSLELVVTTNPNLTLRFYEILFSRYPELQPLFGRNSRENQAKMLAEALVATVDHLEDAPWLVQNLGALGARHLDYQVTDDMYPKVGDALLSTLAETAGEAWSPELQAQWAEAYGAICGLMGVKAAA